MKLTYRHSIIQIPLILFTACFALAALGQDNVGDESTINYPASYFTQYAPVTAQDMLDRIPGLSGSSRSPGNGRTGGGNGGRGLGGGGGNSQTLINGKRTAGKSNGTRGQLARISADQVNYIEIIRGTSGDLDVRGSGQVVNVVLFEDLDSSSISFEASSDRYADGEIEPGGSIAYAGKSGNLNFLFSANAEPRYDHTVSKENSILGDFSANDTVREDIVREQTSYTYTTNLDYTLNGNSSFRINGLYSQNDDPTDIMRRTNDLTVTPNITSIQHEDNSSERDNWEIGADFEYNFANGNRFKILVISNENNRNAIRERFDLADDSSETKNLFLASGSSTTERIIRSSYTMGMFEGQDIEFGTERAETILDSTLALGLPDTTGSPSIFAGGLIPQSVPNANSKVKELRHEPFLIHNWTFNPKMSLESTLLYESSEIIQSGDVSNKRDFGFLKPKLDLRYDLTPTLQLQGTAEKVVLQLRFSDFVAATDNQDNDANTQAGNANLKQEWLWRYEAGAEYRLPNDSGVIDANFFYHQHHDKISRVDVSSSEDQLRSANGNIGDGQMWGVIVNTSLRMNIINMPNLLVSSSVTVRDSTIKDPFLGIDRRFTFFNRGHSSLSFRHDIPRWNLNYGVTWNNQFDGNRKRFDIDDIEIQAGDTHFNFFIEHIAFGGISFRFEADNIDAKSTCRERQRFVGRISSNILEEIEDQCSIYGRTLSLRVTGTF